MYFSGILLISFFIITLSMWQYRIPSFWNFAHMREKSSLSKSMRTMMIYWCVHYVLFVPFYLFCM
uniref:Uncharacterized protein n=1 Tax=Arundo donax TaxID=35708 RepID=A0A0A9B1K6_ARUDO